MVVKVAVDGAEGRELAVEADEDGDDLGGAARAEATSVRQMRMRAWAVEERQDGRAAGGLTSSARAASGKAMMDGGDARLTGGESGMCLSGSSRGYEGDGRMRVELLQGAQKMVVVMPRRARLFM